MGSIINQKISSIQEYTRINDNLYLIIYIIIFIVSLLLIFGYQNVIVDIMPSWNFSYMVSNLGMAILSLIAMILLIFKRRDTAYYYVGFLALLYISWTLIEIWVLLFNEISGGVIFRTSFNIIISAALIFRIQLINIAIREGT